VKYFAYQALSQKIVSFANYLWYKLNNMKKQKRLQSPKPDKMATPGSCGPVDFDDVTKIHPALQASLGYCLFKSSSIYRARLELAIKSLNLNVHHLALLSVLSNEKSSTNQNQMCDELGVDKASMVKLIDHIEKQKLVERVNCAEDRRVKFLHLTSKGLSTLAKARKIKQGVEAEYLKPLTPEEQSSFRSILPRLIQQGRK
jgi:DNA-binding MarR family transcriptional regulator